MTPQSYSTNKIVLANGATYQFTPLARRERVPQSHSVCKHSNAVYLQYHQARKN